MRAGRVASLIVLSVLTMLAVAIGVASHVLVARGFSSLQSVVLIALGVGTACAGILIPLGISLDRAIRRLEESIQSGLAPCDSDALSSTPANQSTVLFPTGFRTWLLPIARAFGVVAERFHQREQTLRSHIRELEIRHRVAEAERRQVEHVLHALRDPVIVTNAYNEVVMINDAAASLFGFDVREALHRPVTNIVQDKRLCKVINDARESANFSDTRHLEIEIDEVGQSTLSFSRKQSSTAANGESVRPVYDVTLTCIGNHKGEVAGVVTILRDLTRERELAQMKTDFVSKASHELRTPLSSIRAYVEMLVDGEFEEGESGAGMNPPAETGAHRPVESLHDIYRIIQDETERLSRLIDNMLNISRIEAGIVQIDREVVDMKELIDRAVHTLGPQAEEKAITLIARPSAVDLSVEGDSDMLYQTLLNLISNALKYTPAVTSGSGSGGRVIVSADTDNLTRSVVVSVSDTGLGIPPDVLPRLFDKFFRVENYKRVAAGTGLGLSLCKHIVETVHQGQIGVESKLGMGSRFWFSIPMRYAGSKAA